MTQDQQRLALVTGAARGIGLGVAERLAGDGLNVVLVDLIDEVHGAARGLAAKGLAVEACVADIAREDAVRALVDDVLARHGRLDVLVNNAGTDKTLSIEELDQADFDRVIDVNLRAPFALAKAAFPHLQAKGRGAVINIVSTAAKRAWANASAYHASKWGLLGLSHAMHVEGRPLGIKVTALLAGGMRTPFILDRFPDTPLENLQDPRAVAETVRFLIEQPADTVIPELLVVPMRETSWP